VHASAVMPEGYKADLWINAHVGVEASTDPMPIGKDPMNGVSHFVINDKQNRSVSPNTVTGTMEIIGYAGGVTGIPGMDTPSASVMASICAIATPGIPMPLHISRYC